MSNNSSSNTNTNSISNSNNFEVNMLRQANEYVEAARKALKNAKKYRKDVKKKAKLSKTLSRLVNRNNINNISSVRKAHNNALKAGVPEIHGRVFKRKETPVGKASKILTAYNNMMSVSKSLKKPSMMTKMGRSAARKLGLRSEKNNRIANHKRLESAYELCESHGICGPEMNRVFNEVADLEDVRTNAERARNARTRDLVRGMPNNAMIRKHVVKMPVRQRHQPGRLRSNIFNRRGARLRAHSIGNSINAHRMYNSNVAPRQRLGMRRGNLPQPKRRTKKVPTRRYSN
jgi:hypothetical protein